MAKRPLPCESYQSFRLFQISASDFGMRRFCVCTYKFLTVVTEVVVHGAHKAVVWSSFGVTCQHKVSQGIDPFI